jgi:hypothetical protein
LEPAIRLCELTTAKDSVVGLVPCVRLHCDLNKKI